MGLDEDRKDVKNYLDDFLKVKGGPVNAAIQYAFGFPGRMWRPLLTLRSADFYNVSLEISLPMV